MPPAHRPTKLTPEIIVLTKRLLKKFVFMSPLADCLGINRTTLFRWLGKGKHLEAKEKLTAEESLVCEFCHTIKKGLADAEVDMADKIARDRMWQAKSWILERRFPERWSSNRKELKELNKKIKTLEEMLNRVIGSLPHPETGPAANQDGQLPDGARDGQGSAG